MMKMMRRCLSCNSIWVNWNIELHTVEKVYAHDCYMCGEIAITDRRIYGGVPSWVLFLSRKVYSLRSGRIVRSAIRRRPFVKQSRP